MFSICIVGSSGIGKTTLVNRHRTGEFTNKQPKTPTSLQFNTTKVLITLNINECNTATAPNVFYEI